MFKCEKCEKIFEKQISLTGHSRIHSPKELLDKRTLVNREVAKRQKDLRIEKYLKRSIQCGECNKQLSYDERHRKFCNKSCAAKYNNKQREPVSEEQRRKISEAVRKTHALKPKKIRIKKYGTCSVCGNEFEQPRKGTNKLCSKQCRDVNSSIKRSQWLLQNGTSNFHTKRTSFSYKWLENFVCDSKLEQAALVYLIDIFKANRIEKFRNILNFWEGDVHRTFNPDFYVVKDNKVYIVEVKMKWIEKTEHDYNRTIPLKKIALQNFCNSKGYEMIWLDFDYDKEFGKIYYHGLKRILKNNE